MCACHIFHSFSFASFSDFLWNFGRIFEWWQKIKKKYQSKILIFLPNQFLCVYFPSLSEMMQIKISVIHRLIYQSHVSLYHTQIICNRCIRMESPLGWNPFVITQKYFAFLPPDLSNDFTPCVRKFGESRNMSIVSSWNINTSFQQTNKISENTKV